MSREELAGLRELGELGGLESVERCQREALRVGELVSAGGQASVERVVWAGEALYLKRLLPSERSEIRAEGRARLACEARALLLASDHPLLKDHLKALLCNAQGELDGVILTPVEGASLSELLRASPPLSPLEVAWCMEELIGWLEHIKKVNLWAHGDIAPRNVMVTSTGRLTLIDWGSAWGPTLPYSEARCAGTPPYRPPHLSPSSKEQEAGAPDLYALGALWLKLVTGVSPQGDLSTLKASDLTQSGWPKAWSEALIALLNTHPPHLPHLRASLWAFTKREGSALEHLKSEVQGRFKARL